MPNHIMVDLETWGKDPGCDLRSIGAVVFDPATGELGERFYRNIDGGYSYGLIRDPDTVLWWSKQEASAQDALESDKIDIAQVIREFTGWWLKHDPDKTTRFWANGPNFDESILAAAYRAVSIEQPWHYRTPRCQRTINDLAGGVELPFEGVKHHALADAEHQARVVSIAWQRLHPPKPVLTTREKIEHWMRVFECQWNDKPVTLTVTQRELLGRLLLEECLESLVAGLGLRVAVNMNPEWTPEFQHSVVEHVEGVLYDPIEFADGLADTAWVAYFNARVAGFNLDEVIEEVYESNMSKLDAGGRPIHNECIDVSHLENPALCESESYGCLLKDGSKPRGKILKGPNFRTPDITKAIFF